MPNKTLQLYSFFWGVKTKRQPIQAKEAKIRCPFYLMSLYLFAQEHTSIFV